MHLSTKKAARHGRQVHRSFSGAPSFLRCTEPSQVHRSCPSALKFQWRIEGHSHGRGGGTPRAAQPPAIRFGPYGPSRATLENAFAFPQLCALAGSSPGSGPGRKNGPVAGAITRMVGAVGLEPTIPKAEDFKSPAYANSATPPCASKCTTPRCRRARTEPLRESAEPPRMRTARSTRSTEQQPGPGALTLGTPPRQSGFMGQGCVNPPMAWRSPGGRGTASPTVPSSWCGRPPTPSGPAAARRRRLPAGPRAPSRTTRGSSGGAWWRLP